MSIQIGNYTFDGPFTNPASLKNVSGVYGVLARSSSGNGYAVIDIGESATVRDRVTNHDRSVCWARNRQAGLRYAAFYCDQPTRIRAEQPLRRQFNLVCGDR
jgi:hypothetical protein